MLIGVNSHKGIVREKNEDYYNIVSDSNGKVIAFIIADGMGGHNSGEVASKMAVDCVTSKIKAYSEQVNEDDEFVSDALVNIIQTANKDIFENAQNCADNFGMGTTLIVAMPKTDKMHIGHVGDSRAYRIREGKIHRITTDHSYIEELLRNGTINQEEAKIHPKKNLITRALGSEELEVDYYLSDLESGDMFVFCTDGLTNMVDEETIENVCKTYEPQQASDTLIELANNNGGEDNITVIVVKI
jgi:Serine/threonine protein phosphatase